ncbi:hypothetical protein WG66_000811, partial [Moniliophthora roreri]
MSTVIVQGIVTKVNDTLWRCSIHTYANSNPVCGILMRIG